MTPKSLIPRSWFGRQKLIWKGFMSGGAGYILSRAALEAVANGFQDEKLCLREYDADYEDAAIGQCAANVGVTFLDTRDDNGSVRFHPYGPEVHITRQGMHTGGVWLTKYAWTPIKLGIACCSRHAVTFHYIKPHDMYLLDYFVYKLKAYGLRDSLARK